jgi:hypothetical protein
MIDRRERRERLFLTALQAVTVIIVVSVMIFVIFDSQRDSRARSAAALAAQQQNAEVLAGIEDILGDVRRAQVNQREAFSRLARRNERLHGRDPGEAPTFDDLSATDRPSPSSTDAQDSSDPPSRTRPDPPEDDPPRRPPQRPNPPDEPEPPPPPPCAVPNPLGGCLIREP